LAAALAIFGGFIMVAYNLELERGFFHHGFWFGFAWGAFPVVTAYIAQTGTISWEAGFLALWAMLYSMAQRKLSFQVRFFHQIALSIKSSIKESRLLSPLLARSVASY
jgi:hypothetical protein